MLTYKIRQAMVAMTRDDSSRPKIITIPVGAQVLVPRFTRSNGTLDGKWDGIEVSFFVQDLNEHAELERDADA